MENIQLSEYQQWLSNIKDRVRQVQQHIVRTANTSLIFFYWEIGQQITEKQQQSQWGDKVLEQLSKDLKTAFPDLTGFSVRNLKYARRFFTFYEKTIGQQPVAQLQQLPMFQIPWRQIENDSILSLVSRELQGDETEIRSIVSTKLEAADVDAFLSVPFSHHYEIILKIKNEIDRWYYIKQMAQNFWSVRHKLLNNCLNQDCSRFIDFQDYSIVS